MTPSPKVTNRALAWQQMLTDKGWLKDNQITLPAETMVYLYFPPGTTDINTIESIKLQHITDVSEHFLIHRLSNQEEEYYLWEDIQCVRIRQKRGSLL